MSDTSEIAEDIQAMSFEEAIAELESIVERLETGNVVLEESIEIYQRGSQLRAYCNEKLKIAQHRIEKITGSGTGTEALDSA